MEIWRGYRPQEGLVFLATGTFLLGTTFLASRGRNHSPFHNVLAPIALGAETIITVSGLGLMMNDSRSTYLRAAERIGLGTTAACHIAVALTDERIHNHFQSGKRFSGSDLLDLGQKFFADFKRHMKDGAQIIFI